MRNSTLILVITIILNTTLFSTFVLSQTSSNNFTSAANNVTAVSCFIVKGYPLVSPVSLTPSCQSRLERIYNSSDINACIPFNQLASKLSQSSPSSDLTDLFNSVCLPKCDDIFISSTLSSFKTDCTIDLAANNSAVFGVELLFTFYSPLISSYCFKNTTGGSCLLKFRQDYAIFAGAGVSPANSNPLNFTVLPDITNVPPSVVCINCEKALANTFLKFLDANPGDYAILGTNQNEMNNHGNIPDTTSTSTSTPSTGTSFFDNPLYKGLIIGGSRHPSFFYVPTPGSSEARDQKQFNFKN
ncbi:13935_t:CDS:2 [Cetraspora pellucida]|uniref:13935_t:CDS:1 n=1 Tax=Cetraspora pellucida TaxID=1433469 RepID=A0A9N9FMG2_9GLOM|nr:13935_t:CDS:2 [Cetraspora pellucida]